MTMHISLGARLRFKLNLTWWMKNLLMDWSPNTCFYTDDQDPVCRASPLQAHVCPALGWR